VALGNFTPGAKRRTQQAAAAELIRAYGDGNNYDTTGRIPFHQALRNATGKQGNAARRDVAMDLSRKGDWRAAEMAQYVAMPLPDEDKVLIWNEYLRNKRNQGEGESA